MNKFFLKIFPIFFILFYTNIQNAKELLIYADDITYDKKNNLVAKGNAKIISHNEIIMGDLIIYNKSEEKFIIPKEFSYKDEKNNYYYGSDGEFSKNMSKGTINNAKLLLNDGSRIVGKKIIRDGDIDIVKKGVYSPCTSRINIKNFVCPIWQLEGETILHDNEDLMLYQKHSKMRVFNLPVFYLPYIVSPSPLRKKRKSGFLNPTINFNFLDTKVSQSVSLPYYFNLDIDKELTLTPTLNYGGGTNSSQRFLFDYNQVISGGNLNVDYTMDTKFENQNNEEWFQNGSIVTEYNQNLNENFYIKANSAVQTSRNYIQSTDQTNELSYASSLTTSLTLYGYQLLDENDNMDISFSTYQATQSTANNKTIPKVLPSINYYSGLKNKNSIDYSNSINFYNIVREENTNIHSEQQQKINYKISASKDFTKYNSKLKLQSELFNQFYSTKNKKIDNKNVSNNYYKIFPIIGLSIETPIRHKNSNTVITPHSNLIISSGQSNSNKISNEDSTNNTYSISKQNNLNRYNGNDKLDNSKRLNYGLNLSKDKFSIDLSQNYEFTNNSNYHKESGNINHLSDALGLFKYQSDNSLLAYETRYDSENNKINRNKFTLENKKNIGKFNFSYLDEKKETNQLITSNQEVFTYSYESVKFLKYNNLNIAGSYNASNERNNEYSIGYKYFDECFGINIDFNRKDYLNDNIKPSDTLTLTFSFKNLGSYKSSNLAVSETDKQDIKWESSDVQNEYFN